MEAVQNFNLIFVLLIAVALANALLAFIVARAGRRTENRIFALVALFVALWTLTNALFRIVGNISSATLLAQLSYFAALGTAATFWHFTWIYPRPLRSRRLDTLPRRLALYGFGGLVAASTFLPGFVVRGKGKIESLNSASHGAGRKMGRKAAINSLTHGERDRYLQERGVKLLGGGLDEAPQAYKDIHGVIAAQTDLVDVIGKFTPRIVRMADEAGDY
ncbi:hypothetical protein EON80_15520 [bacterium]|nr:MAG: hypothetical protein EON80_15520 [bacterium]